MFLWRLIRDDGFFAFAIICVLLGTIFSALRYEQDKEAIFADAEFYATEGKINRFDTFVTSISQDVVVNMEAEYSIKNHLYTTSRFSLGSINFDLAKKIMHEFKQGNSKITIWYNPDKPEIAVVDYERKAARFQFWLFWLASLVPLLLYSLFKVFRYAKFHRP
jgi:hypothetical protein